MFGLIPSCKEVTQTVSESMDQNLSTGRRIRMWTHLIICRYCFRFRKQLLLLRKFSQLEDIRLHDAEPAVSLPPEAKERIRCAMKNHSAASE